MIRLATVDDTNVILDMVKKFIAVSPYSHYDVDDSKILELIFYCLDDKNRLFVLTDTDKPVGMLAATVNQFLFNRELIASEMAWWVEPSYRGRGGSVLKAAFEDWARAIGAKYTHMSSLDTPLVDAMLIRAGYRKTECTFVKEL